jgi:hypothetical protein
LRKNDFEQNGKKVSDSFSNVSKKAQSGFFQNAQTNCQKKIKGAVISKHPTTHTHPTSPQFFNNPCLPILLGFSWCNSSWSS